MMRSLQFRSALPLLIFVALGVSLALLCAASARPIAAAIVTETTVPSQTLPPATSTRTLSPTPTATLTPTPTRTLYTPGPTFTPSLTPGPGNYVVQWGDYLFKIARMFDGTVKGLKSLNNLSSDEIYVGQVLELPSPLPPQPGRAVPALMAGGQYYTVQAGDQLLLIARHFGTTVPDIETANNLTSDAITPGEVLVIPPPLPTDTPFPPERIYTVRPGDQLGYIAKEYGVTIQQIKTLNGLTSNTIFIGQVLYIPTPAPAPTPRPLSTPMPAASGVYIVKLGDRLALIADWYGVTVSSIEAANNLSGDTIYIGQGLVIANPTRHPVAYIVEPGDRLASVAQKFGTTVEVIKLANRMGPDQNTIFFGLMLIIPVPN